MIGVVSWENDETVAEFFQLFKTPWEYYQEGKYYEVIITSPSKIFETNAALTIVYGSEISIVDKEVEVRDNAEGVSLEWEGTCIPIYCSVLTFTQAVVPFLNSQRPGHAVGYEISKDNHKILRIGYDIFREVHYLLTHGQPEKNAGVPTLDLHIEMLRTWIKAAGIEIIEIPPVPYGYKFIVCLTHDVDFIGIKNHLGDHSMWGYLYRASFGSLRNYTKGRIDSKKLLLNLKSFFKLPLVYFGLDHDPWDQFDRYLEIEKGLGSTYFFIPFKNRAGEQFSEKRDPYRAAKYDIGDTVSILSKLISNGCEIGVHGIDAWHSVEMGKVELQKILEKTGTHNSTGIRMHWLVGNEKTPEILDKAGFSYDSTVGYNETLGFKAGTCQVYRPLTTKNLLELPVIIQDTALFSGKRLNASESQANILCEQIIDTIIRVKGVLTILWHQRSLGPERLWDDFYIKLLNKLKMQQVWFATAGEIVKWFRVRRASQFEHGGQSISRNINSLTKNALPPLSLMINNEEKLAIGSKE